ncbi:hypothetical protein ACIPLC_20420 [Kitasatospora sp. NPDC086801]|uniref:hypothetical protein n=1 Tax=Kitasatospora TaxID=2063 RepID=UPI00380F9D5B
MTDEVFSAVPPKPWDPRRHAAIGARPLLMDGGDPVMEIEDDAELAYAFRMAADTVAAHWSATGDDDRLMIVVLQNYRHALELGLKAVLAALIRSIKFELAPDEEPPTALAKAETELPRTHRLAVLVDHLVQLAPMFRLHLHDEVKRICADVHSIDPDGQALRYSMVKAGKNAVTPARPAPVYVDVDVLRRRAGDACTALDALVDQIHGQQDAQLGLGPEYRQGARQHTR